MTKLGIVWGAEPSLRGGDAPPIHLTMLSLNTRTVRQEMLYGERGVLDLPRQKTLQTNCETGRGENER